MESALDNFQAILACLDPSEPFEFDIGNLPHFYADQDLCADDVRDVFTDEPEYYEDETDGPGEWLMVGVVAGEERPLVVPVCTGSSFSKLRPITIFRAGLELAARYRADKGW